MPGRRRGHEGRGRGGGDSNDHGGNHNDRRDSSYRRDGRDGGRDGRRGERSGKWDTDDRRSGGRSGRWDNGDRHRNNYGNSDDKGKHRNNKKSNRRDNDENCHRPPWADYILKLLKGDGVDLATLRSLVSAAAVMLDLVWSQYQRRGMTDVEIAQELQLPLQACLQLSNLTRKSIEGAFGPDAEGDIPMFDADGTVANRHSINASLAVPELFIWELITSNLKNDRRVAL